MRPDDSERREQFDDDNGDKDHYISGAQWRLFFVILVLGVAGITYRLLYTNDLQDSAALYVGLPLLLALGLSLTPRAKSAVGATMKGITVALLLSAPVFLEGYICILFASPIFYLVGYIIAASVTYARKRGDRKSRLQSAGVATLLTLAALEGTTDLTSLPREQTVVVSKVVPASLTEIKTALATAPVFSAPKPFFLRIFPYPVHMRGQGLRAGDIRQATFVAYKHIWWNRISGDAVFAVTESTERKVTFTLVSDTSYVGHYLKWKDSTVEMTPLDNDHTQVTWTLTYYRLYDPSWYFGPLQRYAVSLVAAELIDHAATPRP